MQIVPEWPPVACKFYSCCMRLAATWVQFACNWRPLRYNLHATGGHSSLYATGHQSHTNFACASGKLHAKPPVFCKHAARTIFELKNEDAIKKSENLCHTYDCKGLSINTMHGPIQSRETVPWMYLSIFSFSTFLDNSYIVVKITSFLGLQNGLNYNIWSIFGWAVRL
jgi:hypothetical protein